MDPERRVAVAVSARIFYKVWAAEGSPLGFLHTAREKEKVKRLNWHTHSPSAPSEFLHSLTDPRRGSYLPSVWVNTVVCLQASVARATVYIFWKTKVWWRLNKSTLPGKWRIWCEAQTYPEPSFFRSRSLLASLREFSSEFIFPLMSARIVSFDPSFKKSWALFCLSAEFDTFMSEKKKKQQPVAFRNFEELSNC